MTSAFCNYNGMQNGCNKTSLAFPQAVNQGYFWLWIAQNTNMSSMSTVRYKMYNIVQTVKSL